MDSKIERWSKKVSALVERKDADLTDDSIVLGREALVLYPPSHPIRSGSLIWLANHLWDRYRALRTVADLDEAIDLEREALELCPPGHADRTDALTSIARYLSARFERRWKIEDLEEAIVLRHEALTYFPPSHPDRPRTLGNQAADLFSRYEQLEELDDLQSAIVYDRESIALCRELEKEADRCTAWILLASHLHTRFDKLGNMEDLEEAIAVGKECLAVICPLDHLERGVALSNHAAALVARYKQWSQMEDLDEAISLVRGVLEKYPSGRDHRFALLNNLALFFNDRHSRLGVVADLDEAIALAREALTLCPDDASRTACLGSLAMHLEQRYKQLGAREDIDEAIILGREALLLRPPGHPASGQLAINLCQRYMRLGAVEDLNEVIQLSDPDARVTQPPVHADQSVPLFHLARHLFNRYQSMRVGAVEDLNQAVQSGREALALRPLGHPERSSSLRHLAWHLSVRFKQSGELTDREEMLSLYTQLAQDPQVVSSSELSALELWIEAAEDAQHPTTLLAYETALRSLDQYLTPHSSLQGRLAVVEKHGSLGVDAFSASLRNGHPARAIEFLEQGRGIVWNHLARLRSPLADVMASGPAGKALAGRFKELASSILRALDSADVGQLDGFNTELQTVIAQIRGLPGLSRFLSHFSFSDLQQAASEGPVIIVNASKYGCDVLVVLADRDPVHIPLKITQERTRGLSSKFRALAVRARRADVTDTLALSLQALWDEIVSPIAEFLQTIHPRGSRIWWCPTAEFSSLPLHAAGPHKEGEPNFYDLYVSSYTPTLTALIHARRAMPSTSTPEQKRFLAIGHMGEGEVPYISTEIDLLSERLECHETVTRLEDEECTVARVVDELGRHGWVHLTCPVHPNRRRPFESAFVFSDGPLTIQRLIRCEVNDPRVAYISAGYPVNADRCADEGINLASAMLFVGFRSVVGRLWGVGGDGSDGEDEESDEVEVEKEEEGDEAEADNQAEDRNLDMTENGTDGGGVNENEDDEDMDKAKGEDEARGRLHAIVLGHVFYSRVDEEGQMDHTRAAYAVHAEMTMSNIPLHWRISYVHLGA